MSIVSNSKDPNLTRQLQLTSDDEGDTAQGFYVIGADGKFYGWKNVHYAPEVLKFIDTALEAFRRNPPAPIHLTEEQMTASFSRTPESSTSVVQVFTRISPPPAGCDDLNRSVGRDYMWIYGDDVHALLSACDSADSFILPRNLVARLVRFHLIDNVRGEPDEWESKDVKQADFTAKFIGQDTLAKHVEFKGEYRQETDNHRRGQQGTLYGKFDIVTATRKIEHFRAYGQATAWGESRFTPGAPKGKFALVTAMISANDRTADVIAPHALWGDGQEYHTPEFSLPEPQLVGCDRGLVNTLNY
jgi:hypothetical protein